MPNVAGLLLSDPSAREKDPGMFMGVWGFMMTCLMVAYRIPDLATDMRGDVSNMDMMKMYTANTSNFIKATRQPDGYWQIHAIIRHLMTLCSNLVETVPGEAEGFWVRHWTDGESWADYRHHPVPLNSELEAAYENACGEKAWLLRHIFPHGTSLVGDYQLVFEEIAEDNRRLSVLPAYEANQVLIHEFLQACLDYRVRGASDWKRLLSQLTNEELAWEHRNDRVAEVRSDPRRDTRFEAEDFLVIHRKPKKHCCTIM